MMTKYKRKMPLINNNMKEKQETKLVIKIIDKIT